ncbi:hypothetical protein LX32DRAFT_83539 [Colletotrichum zoysiae]|uniref:Uncharacterized protein n=1 Tax=Colletotrichum zoysiae TaxID=1216348 RepID=A0AAD9H9B2_9PEZI|nr:hypothetical protein LX32DRAFT_83539 [Colletotrichum zoysiae]
MAYPRPLGRRDDELDTDRSMSQFSSPQILVVCVKWYGSVVHALRICCIVECQSCSNLRALIPFLHPALPFKDNTRRPINYPSHPRLFSPFNWIPHCSLFDGSPFLFTWASMNACFTNLFCSFAVGYSLPAHRPSQALALLLRALRSRAHFPLFHS